MSSEDNETADGIAAFCYLALVAPALMVDGWVLSIIWKWFVVPLGAPAIGIAEAIGLGLLANWVTHHAIDCAPSEKSYCMKMAEKIAGMFLVPLFTLGICCIIHKFQ